MHIWFDSEFDGNPWPGPLAISAAVAGEAWLGPAGLLNLLELQLGLAGPMEPENVRAASLIPRLRDTAGFWTKSVETDPFAVAQTLLRWRDALCMAGWRGQGISPRLTQLAAVTSDLLPGVPDRLAAVSHRLEKHKTDLKTVVLLEHPTVLSRTWQVILRQLEDAGVTIRQATPSPAKAKGDLAAAQSKDFNPQRDGALQLLRTQGPMEAAEQVAAWLAASDWRDTVIIGGDSLLDIALRRHGLPTLGAKSSVAGNAILEILPLVIALGWSPPDPQRALELLTLPVSPVPHGIAHRLVEALQQWPAVDSDDWRAALAEGLAGIEDKESRQRLQERLDVLLQPTVKEHTYPAAELKRRVATLQHWLRGRLESEQGSTQPWEAALAQCLNFQRLIDLTALTAFTRPQIQRVIEEAINSVDGLAVHPAQAGLHRIASPGAIAGTARQVIWWDFTRNSVASIEQLPLSGAERNALAQVGVVLPEPAAMAQVANRLWRRPLLYASDHLILVCPRNGSDGEEQYPHPLWDEIAASLQKTASIAPLVLERRLVAKSPKLKEHALLPWPSATDVWVLPANYTPQRREKESPTGAGSLVGCPFQWVLQYWAKVREGGAAALPDLQKLIGSTAHELLARLLKAGVASPQQAELEALALFDSQAPRLAAPLFMPGNEPFKARARAATGRAAGSLFAHLGQGKLGIVAAEETRSTKALGSVLEGRADLVAGPPEVIVDLKSGGEKYHRQELEDGAAYQLACYSRLYRTAKYMPPVAFFILESQQLLTTSDGVFPKAKVVTGPGPQETWEAFEKSYQARWKELAAGNVIATGQRNDDGELDPSDSMLVDGQLRLTPPCHFCSFSLLCGHYQEAR